MRRERKIERGSLREDIGGADLHLTALERLDLDNMALVVHRSFAHCRRCWAVVSHFGHGMVGM